MTSEDEPTKISGEDATKSTHRYKKYKFRRCRRT